MGNGKPSPDAGPKDGKTPHGVPSGSKDAGLSSSMAHANKNLGVKTRKCVTLPCQREKIKLIELVEVVTRSEEGVVVGAAARSSEKKTLVTRTDKHGNSYKQYINLDKNMDGAANRHPEYGDYIELRARVVWVAGYKATPVTKKRVYWKFKLEPGDGRPPSKPGEMEGFWGIATTDSPIDKDGWTNVVRFYFSKYARDKFTIIVQADENGTGKPSGKVLQAGTYQVWRRFWYEVDTMQTRGRSLALGHSQLNRFFEPVYLEWQNQGKDNNPSNKWCLQSSELLKFADDYFGAEKSPCQIHLVAVDHIADKKYKKIWFLMDESKMSAAEDTYWIYDGDRAWLKSAKYDDGRGWKDLDKSKVNLVKSKGINKKIQVDLSKGPVIPSKAKPFQVVMECVLADTSGGQVQRAPHAFIALGMVYDSHDPTDSQGKAKRGTDRIMVHELGHLLGMVPTTSSTYDVDSGTESHCKDPDCVMYNYLRPVSTMFCNQCQIELRKVNLAPLTGAFEHPKGKKA